MMLTIDKPGTNDGKAFDHFPKTTNATDNAETLSTAFPEPPDYSKTKSISSKFNGVMQTRIQYRSKHQSVTARAVDYNSYKDEYSLLNTSSNIQKRPLVK